jgi:carboxypeptidase family protein
VPFLPTLLLLTTLSVFLCAGQVAPPMPQAGLTGDTKTYPLSGTVTNAATGEPIRRALVHVNGPMQLATFTGPDGRFQLTGVPQGQASVTAEKPGFFDEQALHPGSYTPQNAAVNVGPGTNELHLQLTPEAKIRGRVLDPDGEAIDNLQVQLVTWEISEGRKQLQMGVMASTDDRGIYRIEGLTPGQYFIRTLARPVFSTFGAVPRNAYAPQYYPNSPDLASAQSVELKAGEQAEADFTLHPAPTSNISGIAAGAQNGLSISFEGSDHEQTPANYLQFDPATGKFLLGMVPSGSWTLHFISNDAQGNAYYAEQNIHVNGTDLAGLHVLLQPAPAIPVIVNHAAAIALTSSTGEGSPPANQRPGVQVQLLPVDNASNERFYAGPRPGGDPQGALFIQGVHPGNYKVVAQAFGPECVESVSAGNVDLMHNDSLISPGSQPPPITVSLRNNCATLSGTIHAERQNAPAFVIIVPDSAPTEPQLFPVQSNQNFPFARFSPGTYHVWAFSNVAGLEYANPDVLRDFPSQQITLGPNQKVNLNLDLVTRGSN